MEKEGLWGVLTVNKKVGVPLERSKQIHPLLAHKTNFVSAMDTIITSLRIPGSHIRPHTLHPFARLTWDVAVVSSKL